MCPFPLYSIVQISFELTETSASHFDQRRVPPLPSKFCFFFSLIHKIYVTLKIEVFFKKKAKTRTV